MNKGFKIVAFTLLSALLILYLCFIFVLPNVIKVEEYKTQIQSIIREKAKINLDFENAKIITTPLLGVGAKIDNIIVKLPDDSVLFSADELKARVALPSLLLMTVKVSCLEIEEPYINLEIENNKNFKLASVIEEIINAGKEQKLEQKDLSLDDDKKGFKFNPQWIRIKVPKVKLEDYVVSLKDLKSGHYINLKGEELNAGYFNGKTAKLKTYAEIFSDEQKNITANIDLNTYLPKFGTKLDKEDDPAERVDLPFINPVTMYRNYDLKANLDTKLRVRQHNGEISSFGHFDIDNITLKVMNIKLPESYVKAKTFGNKINLDTKIYPANEQYVSLLGNIVLGHNPKIDMYIKTADIKFNDLLLLSEAFLDSLHIKNELSNLKAEGHFVADCNIKTNLKKWKSSGAILVKDGGINVKNIGKVLSQGNINIKLDGNNLDIRNSSIMVGNAPLFIDGNINEKSIADIKIQAEKIPLSTLYKAFAPENLKKQYNLTSGNATLNASVNGKLKEAVSGLNLGVDNLKISNKNLVINNEKLFAEFLMNKKELVGKINNDGLKIVLPKTSSKLVIPNFNLELADKNIIIKENNVLLNDNTKLQYSGEIIDFTKLKSIIFNANGLVNSKDLMKVIGNDLAPLVHYNGSIPVKLTFDGDKQKQTMFAQALCDNLNFITPVDLDNVKGANTTLQTVIDFKEHRIKIKKTGLYKRNISVDEKGNEIINLEEIFGVDGTVVGKRINLIKLTMPKAIKGKIYAFPESRFTVNGRGFIFGESNAPRFRGGYEITDISIPEILLSLRKAGLDFKGHNAKFEVKDLLLNGSDIQVDGEMSLLPSKIFKITNLDVKSGYFNLDKVMKVLDNLMKYVPQNSNKSTQQSNAKADIPVNVQAGSIDFRRIVVGNINIKNVQSNINLAKNIFNLKNLKADIFDGKVRGNIAVDLVNIILKINVQGNNVDVEKALKDAVGMKDALSGKALFKANISLAGTDLESQMRSLKGQVDFNIKDGQFGPFGKLENLIIAENIRDSQLFQNALGGVLSGLTTIDTTHFSELIGTLTFDDGICHISPITSEGDILSLYLAGDFDLLRNYADMKARARMASLVSNLLGPIGAINPANLVGNAASMNIVTAKAFSIFCEMIPEQEMLAIPSFANKYVDNSATKFQLVIRGDVAKPLTLVKSFKWLATETEYENAVDYVNSIPEPVEGSEATTIEEVIQEVEAEKRTVKYKVKHMFDKDIDAKEINK